MESGAPNYNGVTLRSIPGRDAHIQFYGAANYFRLYGPIGPYFLEQHDLCTDVFELPPLHIFRSRGVTLKIRDTESAITMKGTLLDDEGNPMPHCNIILQSLPQKSVTDYAGEYAFHHVDTAEDHHLTVYENGVQLQQLTLHFQEGGKIDGQQSANTLTFSLPADTTSLELALQRNESGKMTLLALDTYDPSQNPKTGDWD